MRPRIMLALVLLLTAFPAWAEMNCAGQYENRPDLIKCSDLQKKPVGTATEAQPTISGTVTAGGLTCFTVTPADASKDTPKLKTCDELCADRASACTGVTSSLNPPQSCASPATRLTCRCCEVIN